jgi:mevalonate kinase
MSIDTDEHHADAAFGYAPGKIILFGEHAVVYGQPALAATLDRGIRVAVSKNQKAGLVGPVLRGSGFGLVTQARPDPDGEGPEGLRRALASLVERYGEKIRDLSFMVDGAIPVGSGLGSSAALSVAIIRGVHQFFGDPISQEQLIEDALLLEKIFHGNPSGVDHSTIVHGGLIAYRKSANGETSAVESLNLPRRLRFAIALAGQHTGTARAVKSLRDRMKRHPEEYDYIHQGIGRIVEKAHISLLEGHLAAVGELMDLNQGLLNCLGVSTPAIESLCSIGRERGALGVKLTGAGGGGAVIALVDDDPEPVRSAFEEAGFESFSAEIETPTIAG